MDMKPIAVLFDKHICDFDYMDMVLLMNKI